MLVIRLFVCGYLIYLGGSLIYDQMRGASSIQPWISWVFGVLFVAGGLVIGLFTWKKYRANTSEGPEEQEKPEE